MKRLSFVVGVLFLFSNFAFAENELVFSKKYSRGDDDLAYSYETAQLDVQFRLNRVGRQWDASVTFLANLSTEEAQGFAESVRFGMREVKRQYRSKTDAIWQDADTVEAPVLFKFVRITPQGFVPDAATQRVGDSLSSNALRTRQAVPGNRPEALHKTLGGTLALGLLEEGQHQGTVFVQQLTGQTPSNTDTDISVRHLIQWQATVQDGRIAIDIGNGVYKNSSASVDIVAPAWDGTIRPHRVVLLSNVVQIDGKSLAHSSPIRNPSYQEKAKVLMQQDLTEFRKEYSLRERIQKRRGR
jgi:hypothetical protein